MQSTSTIPMMKNHKAFDDFFSGISFSDFDVRYTKRTTTTEAMELYDSDDDTAFGEEDTARVVFAKPIKVVEPVVSPASVDSPHTRLARRKATKQETKPTNRVSFTACRRHRDRRRNQLQRERENIKRKIKQAQFVKMRSECFRREFLLRDAICTIISSVMEDRRVGVQEAISLLPSDVRRVVASAAMALRRYRNFTGQKHIAEQLNRFPAWSADGY